MFHALPAHLQPQPLQLAHSHPQAVLAMHTAYPTLNDARSMMHLMPSSTSPTTPAAPSRAMMNAAKPQQHFSASLSDVPVAKPDHLTPTWCAPSFPFSSSPQQQQQQQPCFWVDGATGAMRPVTQEEMSAIMASHTPATVAVPAYATTVPTQALNASSGSLKSAATSLSGAVPYMPVVAMAGVPLPPPPPLATKAVNGLQYVHGELYEGFVKRYNPNRGFGFLTATFHVKADDTASSVSSSAAASLTTAPNSNSSSSHRNTSIAAMPTAKERRVPVHLGDIFVHQSLMHMQGFRTLPVGGRVRFRVGYKDGHQTFQAVDVELLPQVVPQGVEADFINTASPTSAFSPALPSPSPTASEAEKEVRTACSSTGGSNSEHHSEAERFFFAFPKEATLGRSPVTLTQGESEDGTEEDDSPLIELAYEVYASLED